MVMQELNRAASSLAFNSHILFCKVTARLLDGAPIPHRVGWGVITTEKSVMGTFWRMAVLCYFNLRIKLLCFRHGWLGAMSQLPWSSTITRSEFSAVVKNSRYLSRCRHHLEADPPATHDVQFR